MCHCDVLILSDKPEPISIISYETVNCHQDGSWFGGIAYLCGLHPEDGKDGQFYCCYSCIGINCFFLDKRRYFIESIVVLMCDGGSRSAINSFGLTTYHLDDHRQRPLCPFVLLFPFNFSTLYPSSVCTINRNFQKQLLRLWVKKSHVNSLNKLLWVICIHGPRIDSYFGKAWNCFVLFWCIFYNIALASRLIQLSSRCVM